MAFARRPCGEDNEDDEEPASPTAYPFDPYEQPIADPYAAWCDRDGGPEPDEDEPEIE